MSATVRNSASSTPEAWDSVDSFGVYIHWPFCAQKCPYCDFNSHVRHEGVDQEKFAEAYKQELRTVRERVGPRPVTSIFLGGGTPSLMLPKTVADLLDEVAKLWPVSPDAEITLEANPNSVEAERFRGFRDAGVNRVSIGVQSLRDDQLKRLGRLHSVAEAKTAIDIARQTFDRFSFDLIYARPGQSLEDWRTELAEAMSFGPRHLSLYQLTIEPDTPFAALHAAGKLVIPEDDAAAGLFQLTQEMTRDAGLVAYETSNHAAPGEESQHNLIYWRYEPYAGIGPGAHGRLPSDDEDDEIVRVATQTERSPEAWRDQVLGNGHGFVEQTGISRTQAADEMLLMGLRLREGLRLDRMRHTSGLSPDPVVIDALVSEGLLTCNPERSVISATEDGAIVLDEIVRRLSASLG